MKSIVITDNLLAGEQDIKQHAEAVPLGRTWKVELFGAADINAGDSKSSVYVLRFGTEIIKIISVTGATSEIIINKEFTGDGGKKFNIIRKNTSGTDKQCPCWIDMYERQ